ncbi:MAG: hypothetical protein JWO43_57 [Candidatus Adlerbacteria bacterium]|nr:hypothetical protein [Candidatus Adlerbacteria bacterium]
MILGIVIGIVLGIIFLLLIWYWIREVNRPLRLSRGDNNPILSPVASHPWESEAVFNPAAVYAGGRVHMLYRAMGHDGISRIGYASSLDGIHFDERLAEPVYTPVRGFGNTLSASQIGLPHPDKRWGPLSYNTVVYPSGGGWGGAEDPRLVIIGNTAVMTFVAFDGWGFVRMAVTSMPLPELLAHNFTWKRPALMSKPNEINKNWVFFPEKIHGKYALLHSVSPEIHIAYIDSLDQFDGNTFIESEYKKAGRQDNWDSWVRGAGPPPIKTPFGWLLLYHAMDMHDPNKYKVGAMLLDLEHPEHILFRSDNPILEPEKWYENDGKPGVVYACGAVIMGDDLLVYYGGGDKIIAVAKTNMRRFVRKLMTHREVELAPEVY